ncbi:MAG TPA: amylo-alpha-1,6-glucosidase [Pyrinomonadaceae bacterium]|nr:amylo-alpha-1,6-glucosidase [Pyrinomonadaceae bacterium]
MIAFDHNTIGDFSAASSREWLETNGLGGFASSTIIGLNTRRYHGLLTAATKPPVGRIVMLSKLEETLLVDGKRYQLSANQYPGVVHPKGFELQTSFRLDPFPIFTFEVEGVRLQKSIFMIQGENSTVIQYTVAGNFSNSIKLEVRPLIAFRDYHSTTHENAGLNPKIETAPRRISIQPYSDLPVLHFAHHPAEVDSNGFWYRNFQYQIEQERGLDFAEDLFSPFALTFDLKLNANPGIIASTNQQDIDQVENYLANELGRRSNHDSSFVGQLNDAADQFIVQRDRCRTVIAGYHWFSDWGRDTMIALPGLMLTTGKSDVAKSVLLEFAKHVDQGMLPNRFPDAGETPEYNTVDATLWFFEAIRSLVQCTGDYEFAREHFYPVLNNIIDWHVKGTRYNIHVDTDGLLESGEPGVQLTWMDAKVGDWVVTPRHGKPVEIQALWYNALRIMEKFATQFGDNRSTHFAEMARRAKENFNRLFWNEDTQCLCDVVNRETRDTSIRPNQLLAISLPYSMMTTDRAQKIMKVVERELLTPRGLRTLSPRDPNYRGRYEGDGRSRDSVYHQGTVWPWLMGPYFSAYEKAFGSEAVRQAGSEWLANFEAHLNEACLGQVSEIFDGDAPHAPRGCAAQAWSVSEILRAAVEVIYRDNVDVKYALAGNL